jgi:hypothetical protein
MNKKMTSKLEGRGWRPRWMLEEPNFYRNEHHTTKNFNVTPVPTRR